MHRKWRAKNHYSESWLYFFYSQVFKNMGASLVAQLIKILPAMQETQFDSWVGKISWRRDRLPIRVFLGLPGGSDEKESTCNVGDLGLIPGLGRSPGGEPGNPLWYSCLENPHGQMSLVARSMGSQRVRHDWASKHGTAQHSRMWTPWTSTRPNQSILNKISPDY